MAKTDSAAVDRYIAAQPPATQRALTRMRSVIRKAVPAAVETIGYQMPAYKLHGRPLLYFAGWKEHFALYPASGTLVARFSKELEPYVVAKGTIRFPLTKPVPAKLIERIAKTRAREVTESEAAKKGVTTKSSFGETAPGAKKATAKALAKPKKATAKKTTASRSTGAPQRNKAPAKKRAT